MSSIDNRIVDMKFNNSQFKSGVQSTLDLLEKLKKGLKLDGAKNSLKGLNEETKKFSLSSIGEALENIGSKFSAFGAIGFAALQRLTNFAIDAGKKMASALIDPIVEGGSRRALNIEQAKFQFKGLGMDVAASMKSANDAVDGTAFALDEAAVVAAQFGASGMQAGDEMTAALRGISGVAAMAGASYADIGNVFTKVAGQGRLMGDDLNRLATRGVNAAATLAEAMGKTEEEVRNMVTKGQIDFQTFASAMNDAFGEHATKANETYTGSLSNMRSALARIGQLWFYGVSINEDANGHYERQRRLFNALTPVINQVKDALVPLFDTLNKIKNLGTDNKVAFLEGIDLHQFARLVWVVADTLQVLYDTVQTYVNPISRAFKEVFRSIAPDPAPEPWFLIFAWSLRDFIRSLALTAEGQGKLYKSAKNLFTIFKTGGAIVSGVVRYYLDTVDVVIDLAKAFGGLFVPVFKFLSGLRGGQKQVKDFSTYVTEFFDALIEGRRYVVDNVVDALERLAEVIDHILNGPKDPAEWGVSWEWALQPITKMVQRLQDAWGALVGVLTRVFEPALSRIKSSWQAIGEAMTAVWGFVKPLAVGIGNLFRDIYKAITGFFSGFSNEEILAGINTGVLIWFFATMKKFASEAKGFGGIGKIFKDGFTGAFREFTGVLKAMQGEIKAGILLKIALAIGVLALALMALTLVDPGRLLGAATALSMLMGMVIGTMAAFSKMTGVQDIAKIPLIAIAVGILAGAMLVMAAALKILSTMDWNQTAVALASFLVTLAALTGAAYALSKMSKDVIAGSVAMGLMAGAILLLAGAVLAFGYMPQDVLIQGMAAVGIALAGLTAAALIMGKTNMLASAVGMMAMAAALNMLLVPLTAIGYMPIDVLQQGLLYLGILAGGMVIAGLLMGAASGNMLRGSIGLLAMAAAVSLLVPPLMLLGTMSWENMQMGLFGLAGTMLILAGAAMIMNKNVVGAAGLLAMSGAVFVLAIALTALAAINPERMSETLKNLAWALVILGAAGAILAPVATPMIIVAAAMAIMSLAIIGLAIGLTLLTPAMALFVSTLAALGPTIEKAGKSSGWIALLGAALLVFGIGAAASGVGVLLLGAAFVVLGAGLALVGAVGFIGATALAAVVMAVVRLVEYAGDLLKMTVVILALGAALVVLGAGLTLVGVGVLLVGTGALLLATAMLILAAAFAVTGGELALFIESLILLLPLIAEKMAEAFVIFTLTILEAMPTILEALGELISGILALISEKIPEFGAVVEEFFREVIRVIEVVGPDAIAALVTLILALVDAVVLLVPNFVIAGVDILQGIIDGLEKKLPDLVKSATDLMVAFLNEVADNHQKVVDAAKEVIDKFIDGIGEMGDQIITSGKDVIISWIEGMGNASVEITEAAEEAITKFLAAVRKSVRNLSDEFAETGRTIGMAIADGMTGGLASKASAVTAKAKSVATLAFTAAKAALEVESPSRVFHYLGEMSSQGLADGLEDGELVVANAGAGVGETAISAMQDAISTALDFLDDDFHPTIRPVLDLTDVENGAGKIARLFDNFGVPPNAPMLESLASNMGRVSTPEEAVVGAGSSTVVNLEQNNYSPKPLSRIDIYRQTKNLLSTVKEM